MTRRRRKQIERNDTPLARALLTILALVFASLVVARADSDRDHKDFALGFSEAAGSIATGPAINRLNNVRMEALVKWDGPSTNGGLVVYNGSGCCNGWGILLHGVRFTNLDTPNTTLEWFRFNEGRGITTTGVNGTVLNLVGTTWVRLKDGK